MKPSPSLFAALLLFMLPLASASCAPFLQVTADESKLVSQGQTASFTIVVLNNGPNPQGINANSLCDSSKLDCQFPDFSGPTTIASGASASFHLNANPGTNAGNHSIVLQVFGGTASNACLEERTLSLGVLGQTPSPTAAGAPLSASISPTENIAAQPGETAEYTVIVQNNKPETQFVQLKFGADEGNTFAQTTYADAEQFKLEPGETRTVSVKAGIPPGTPGGVYSFSIRVRATSTAGTAHDALLPARVFVFSPTLSMQWASTPASCLQSFHYSQATHFLSLRNLGEITGPFEAELSLPAALEGHAKLSKTSFELSQREATTLAVSVNASPQVPPGEYAYSVKVRHLNAVALRFDSCVVVRGVVGIDALSATQHQIERGSTQAIVLRVANNGSVASNYSLEYSPIPLRGVELSIEPNNFLLEAGASRLVNLLLDANLSAPLGPNAIPLTLRTTNKSLGLSLLLTIVSSNKSGQSPLEIPGTQFKALEGIPVQLPVAVRNNGFQDLENVELVVDGLPPDWVSVDTQPQPIARSREREFLATFRLPAGANKGRPVQLYAFTLHAVAGLEAVSAPAFLELTTPVRKLGFQLESLRPLEATASEPSKLLLRIAVYNQGNVPLTRLTPSLPYATEYIVAAEGLLGLGPGGQEYLTLEISAPAGASEQDVFLRFESAEGAEKTQAVRLPAISGAGDGAGGSGVDLGWKAVAVVVLLVAIMAVLAKEEMEDFFAK